MARLYLIGSPVKSTAEVPPSFFTVLNYSVFLQCFSLSGFRVTAVSQWLRNVLRQRFVLAACEIRPKSFSANFRSDYNGIFKLKESIREILYYHFLSSGSMQGNHATVSWFCWIGVLHCSCVVLQAAWGLAGEKRNYKSNIEILCGPPYSTREDTQFLNEVHYCSSVLVWVSLIYAHCIKDMGTWVHVLICKEFENLVLSGCRRERKLGRQYK